jgi:hypothetical protein
MSSGLQCNVVGLTDSTGVTAIAAISPNTRVTTHLGAVATVADVVQFPGPQTLLGNWIVPATRVTIGGTPAICANSGSSTIIQVAGVPSPGPAMLLNSPDPHSDGT